MTSSVDIREQLEDAVISVLLPLRKDKGGYLEALREYAGELERLQDDVTADQIKKAVGGHVPAILVAAGGARFESISMARNVMLSQQSLELLFVGAFARTSPARQRGASGLFVAMRDARVLLHGKELGIDGVSRLAIVAEEPMLQTIDLCVWKATYRAQYEQKSAAPPAGKPITEIMASGNLPEIGGVGDDLAFAGGVVTLHDAAGGFGTNLAGLSITIAGAAHAANNGTFPGLAVTDDSHVTFPNAAGVSETFAGTWTITRTTPVVQGLTTL